MQRFSKQRLLPAALVGLLTLGALGGCRGADDGAPAENVEPALRVGIKFDQPGMGLMTDGHPTGLDVDVAAYIAWKLGYSPYQIEWVEAPSPQREQLLIDGVVDMVIATFTIRESNYGVIDYAGPYLIAGQDILVRTGETSIGSVDDLAGHTVCSVAGTSSIQRLEEHLGETANIVGIERYSECVEKLVAGEVDAVSTDNVILAGYAATDEYFGKVRLVNRPFSHEPLGVALPDGSAWMCERVNQALNEMVADGSWQKFVDRHTGGTGYVPNAEENPPATLPCSVTADPGR